MALLMASHDELEAYRHGCKKQRRRKFDAGKVRRKLKREYLTTGLNARWYGLLSDFYLHPNTLDHIFGHRTSHGGRRSVIPYFHRDMCMITLVNLVTFADTALIFWACTQEDDSDFMLAYALHERTVRALRAFTEKMAQDPTVGLPQAWKRKEELVRATRKRNDNG